ncbi:hypothetical protein [Catellatospora sichuanensis]|uniref:hypothetical protein n=1 Tax=Catellatospora sichuanensis TaxID=1969805 RepID=UPI0011846810|nr:hypothetical protein [Catellatospora sichuanensis]
MTAVWEFAFDEDDDLVITSEWVPADRKPALEMLIMLLGAAWLVELYLTEWRRLEAEFGHGYSVGTDAVKVRRIDAEVACIEGIYGQVEPATIGVADLIEMLESLARHLRRLGRL